MGKAIITLNSNHVHKGGWGFTLQDSSKNNYAFSYIKGSLEVSDEIARQWEGTPDLDIKYSDGSTSGSVKSKSSVKAKSNPKPNKLTKQEVWDLSKQEQKDLLNKLGAKKIPAMERGRVNLILKLQ